MTDAVVKKPRFGIGTGILLGAAVVLGANITLVVLALKTDVGYIENKTWERGQTFQATIDAEELFKKSGLRSALTFRSVSTNQTEIVLSMKDTNDISASGFRIVLTGKRGDSADKDFEVSLVENSPGIYSGVHSKLKSGLWLFTIQMTKDQNTYLERKREMAP